MTDDGWLTLSAAAALLGVHASTLRLWADQGEIASTRTAGGHRRFRRSEIDAFAAARRDVRPAGANSGQIVAEAALGRARMQMAEGRLRDEPWYKDLDEARRALFRDAGRQLLVVLVRFLSEEDPEALTQAAELGRVYNRLGLEARLSLADRVRVFLFFNAFLYQSVIDQYRSAGQRGAGQWAALHGRTLEFTNAVLLALVADAEQG
ncbi:MAG TPA: helix-turn-helix domain-containing protein [Anaerolineales bacterium]|nr:helix-turn-helix domain-containing protein [Anaerolineales bacterium]HRF50872.1 helix-turn-helix domain-containing protein [Anaerolineales bacterium]